MWDYLAMSMQPWLWAFFCLRHRRAYDCSVSVPRGCVSPQLLMVYFPSGGTRSRTGLGHASDQLTNQAFRGVVVSFSQNGLVRWSGGGLHFLRTVWFDGRIQFYEKYFDRISIEFRQNFDRISIEFRLNFDRISIEFRQNFNRISIEFRQIFDAEPTKFLH